MRGAYPTCARLEPVRRAPRSSARLALLAGTAALAVAAAIGLLVRDAGLPGDVPVVPKPPRAEGEPVPDPFAWAPDRSKELQRRAARGAAHPLYVSSPGGAEATAARTDAWRDLIESAAGQAGVDADTLEGLVLLESAGRPDAVTPTGLEGAVGLTQILAETARNLLGMRVDIAQSRRLTRRIA